MPTPLLKSLAKKAGKPTAEVEKMWNSVKGSLIEQGEVESDSSFYPKLVGIIKKNLGLKENFVFLEKFKKLLGETNES